MLEKYRETDPEFVGIFERFALDEAVNEEGQTLEPHIRHIAILASLMGCGGTDMFKEELPAALDAGVAPNEIKEIIYQGADYLGMGRTLPFLDAANALFKEKNISLPLESAATTTADDRLEKGAQAQAYIFGKQMLDAWKSGHINRWLAANCFGDYYTRRGLDLNMREMITFCFLAAQGGCEPQLRAHAQGNINIGNSKDFLIKVVSACLPYIGYPRSLNAISCINACTDATSAG